MLLTLEHLEDLKANRHNPDFEMLYQQDADGRALPPITEDRFAVSRCRRVASAPVS